MSFKLLAAASLYDAAKLVEYRPKGERGERTDIGRVIHVVNQRNGTLFKPNTLP
jgi:hypothetical protein